MVHSALTLTNARVVTPDGVHEGWLRVENGRVAALGSGEPAPGPVHDTGGSWVAPGLVDSHIHGGAGHAFPDADPEGAREIVAFNRARGVTSLIGGLVSAAPEDMVRHISVLADLCDAGELAGIYLEGPFIARSKCGAHDPEVLRDPDTAEFERWLEAGRGHVRMITVAPELPGAPELIGAAVSSGVVAAVGHTEASYEQTLAAFDTGATVATHLYNAMRPLNHRDPGPIAAALGERPGDGGADPGQRARPSGRCPAGIRRRRAGPGGTGNRRDVGDRPGRRRVHPRGPAGPRAGRRSPVGR